MLLVIGRVRCAAEQRDELIALLQKMQEDSRREDGCLRYGFFAAVEDPLSFVAVEEWADREALDRHFAEPHLQEFAGRLLELVSSPPEVAIHEVTGTRAVSGSLIRLRQPAITFSMRFAISSGGTSSTCVATFHLWPNGSVN